MHTFHNFLQVLDGLKCFSCLIFVVVVLKMANDVYGILFSNVEAVSGETYETEEVIDEESFLRNVITPIYQVIRNVSIPRSLMLYILTSYCTLSFD